MQFRKKPVVIEAMQFTDENKNQVYSWATGIQQNIHHSWEDGKPCLIVPTLEGEMICSLGDYLIKEPFPTDWRKLYPCKPSIFEQTYEPIELEKVGDQMNPDNQPKDCNVCGVPVHIHGTVCGWESASLIIDAISLDEQGWQKKWLQVNNKELVINADGNFLQAYSKGVPEASIELSNLRRENKALKEQRDEWEKKVAAATPTIMSGFYPNYEKISGAYVWYEGRIERITSQNLHSDTDVVVSNKCRANKSDLELVKVGDRVQVVENECLPESDKGKIVTITWFLDNDLIGTAESQYNGSTIHYSYLRQVDTPTKANQ